MSFDYQSDVTNFVVYFLFYSFRQAYVLEHLPFYSSLLLEFLVRSFQLDLTSELGAFLLFRVAKVRYTYCVLLCKENLNFGEIGSNTSLETEPHGLNVAH